MSPPFSPAPWKRRAQQPEKEMSMSIGTRVVIGYAVLTALSVTLIGFTLSRMSRLNDSLADTVERRYQMVRLTHETLESSIENARRTVQVFLLGGKGRSGTDRLLEEMSQTTRQ